MALGIIENTARVLEILVLILVAVYIEHKMNISWRRLLLKTLLLMFFISVPWTWIRLYKQEEAKSRSELFRDVPEICTKHKLNVKDVLFGVIQSFAWGKEDVCARYYEHLLINPTWKVPPTEALAITFFRFLRFSSFYFVCMRRN